MSTDVKLLSLPAGTWARDMHGEAEVFDSVQMHDYARANMEPLIAENERLRAEVGEHRAEGARWASAARSYRDRWLAAKARAERLAEALRKIAHFKLPQFTGPYGMACACVYEANAALDQEGGND